MRFVAGLGPRKAAVLRKKVVGGKRGYIKSREDLFLRSVLTPTVFRNAASFLRFSSQRIGVLHNKVMGAGRAWCWFLDIECFPPSLLPSCPPSLLPSFPPSLSTTPRLRGGRSA